MAKVTYYLHHQQVGDNSQITKLFHLLHDNQCYLDLPKNDPARMNVEQQARDLYQADPLLRLFRRSEVSFVPGDMHTPVRIVLSDVEFDIEQYTMNIDTRLTSLFGVGRTLSQVIAKVEVSHTFVLPDGYVRELGYYSLQLARGFLSWENQEGGRYRATVQEKTLSAAVELILQIMAGELQPTRIWHREPLATGT